eukprot:m51a1_g2603 hypothetical protein (94) ;mRNA; r:463999-464614
MSGLKDLPSKGFFAQFNQAKQARAQEVPKYICAHDTAPPEGQRITTDQTSPLIRSVMHRRKAVKTQADVGKRPAEDQGQKETKRPRVSQPPSP